MVFCYKARNIGYGKTIILLILRMRGGIYYSFYVTDTDVYTTDVRGGCDGERERRERERAELKRQAIDIVSFLAQVVEKIYNLTMPPLGAYEWMRGDHIDRPNICMIGRRPISRLA